MIGSHLRNAFKRKYDFERSTEIIIFLFVELEPTNMGVAFPTLNIHVHEDNRKTNYLGPRKVFSMGG